MNEIYPTVFVHRGMIVDLAEPHGHDAFIRPLDVDSLRHHLARDARWYAREHGVVVEVAPPVEVVKDMLAGFEPPLPWLDGLLRAPHFAADGTLHDEPGYCVDTGTYYAPGRGLRVPRVPRSPSDTDVATAKDWLHGNLLVDFPFVGPADRANATALLLLPFARELIRGPTPLHLIDKPTPGSGGTLLANVLLIPALGHDVAPITEALSDDGWRECLTMALRANPSAVLIDGVSKPLESGQLASAITATVWQDTHIGASEQVTHPVQCAWVANGNNPILSAEMARRCVRIRLDPKGDRPFLRSDFRRRLPAWAYEHRADLIWAALTLIQAWLAANRPSDPTRTPRLGMFEEWSETLSGILAHAGIPSFLANLNDPLS